MKTHKHNHNHTYSSIAHQTGLSISHVSRVMRGEKEPSLTALCKIAYVLDMSADEFVKRLGRRKIGKGKKERRKGGGRDVSRDS